MMCLCWVRGFERILWFIIVFGKKNTQDEVFWNITKPMIGVMMKYAGK